MFFPSARPFFICVLVLALGAAAQAQEPLCYSSHDCPKTKMPDTKESGTGTEAAKGKVDVNGMGIVTFDVSDMQKNTQMQIKDCFVEYHNECKPEGKTSEASATADALMGYNPSAEKCAKVSKKPFKVHASITYTTKDGKQVTKSGSAKANKDQSPVTGEPCNGYVPVGTCVTP